MHETPARAVAGPQGDKMCSMLQTWSPNHFMTSVPHAFCEMYVRRCRNTNLCELEKQTKLQVCGQKKPIKLIYIIIRMALSKSWWVE